jgi:hypothetical protein
MFDEGRRDTLATQIRRYRKVQYLSFIAGHSSRHQEPRNLAIQFRHQ